MAKSCLCCGKKIGLFIDEFSLSDDKCLCDECANGLREEICKLYYVTTEEECKEIKAKVFKICREKYNAEVTEAVIRKMNTICKDKNFIDGDKEDTEIQLSVDATTDIEEERMETSTETKSKSENSSGMYTNIGGKIKGLAHSIAWIGIILSLIFGIVLMVEVFLTGLLIMGLGVLVSWVSTLLLYGFGQLIENTDILVEEARKKR